MALRHRVCLPHCVVLFIFHDKELEELLARSKCYKVLAVFYYCCYTAKPYTYVIRKIFFIASGKV